MPARTANPVYRANRATILRDQPLCHWCHRQPATEADHLIPHAAGGTDELDNLVPACKRCNGRRGAEYKNARDARRRPTVLGSRPTLPPRPSFVPLRQVGADGVAVGHDQPRLRTMPADRVGSRGPEVVEWARRVLELELMPWQVTALDAMLAYNADGEWCDPLALVSVARQNGKSTLLKCLAGWWLTEYAAEAGPQTILSTAHNLELAMSLFRDLAPVLEAQFSADVRWTNGATSCELAGSKWIVRAASPSAGHGYSVTLLLVDEVWNVSSDALDVGLLPTQRAQPNPLAVMFSTAGTEASASMLRWREQGVRAIDDRSDAGLLLLEWSAPPELDPMSPAAWAYANPALGHTLKLATIEREAASPNRAAFLRSSVNLWVQSDRAWLSPGAWQACATDTRPLDGGVVAIEVALDDARYWAVRVNRNGTGQLVASVEFVTETMDKTWEKIGALAADPKLVIAITPTLDVHTPGHLKKRVQIVGYQEITRYTAAVRQMILERRILHTGEAMLAEHVGRAVAARTGGTIALSSRTSPGPIELARCLVWAAGIAASAPRSARPIVATASPTHRVA